MSAPVPAELLSAQQKFARPDALDFIRGARSPRGKRRAAVLILLGPGAEGYDLVLIEKRADLRSHAGQIAFPGGGIESIDVDPVAAALREAQEEVGVEPPAVTVLGVLPAAHIPRSGFDVTSVVGWWSDPVGLVPVDVGEVAAVHQVPVSRLLDPANRSTWVHHGGFSGPAFLLDDLYVWGFTAYLLDGLFDLLGWTMPWDAGRTSEIPPRFLSERL
ncbi:MAG TPA: CoA pyrophosphatase [Propionicimonas sp.]|nr:CoA pyrophosphatase [Propionicimonas sp.]